MGRGKLPLRLIEKERARRITCMKRKKGLLKKAYELSTLCDVRVCMIIYDAAADQNDHITTYPEDPHSVHRIVADYRNYKIQNPTNSKRDLDLFDFFSDRVKKLEAKAEKQPQQIVESDRDRPSSSSSASVWDPRIDDFTADQLSELLVRLDAKIEEFNKFRAERSSVVIVDEQPHSNSDGYYYQGHVEQISFCSPGFERTAQIDDHLPVMNNDSNNININNNNPFSFTKLLEAPDNNCYGFGNIYDFSLLPANNYYNYNYNADVAGRPVHCFAPPVPFYCPIQTIMGSADDRNNQNLYGPDLSFYGLN